MTIPSLPSSPDPVDPYQGWPDGSWNEAIVTGMLSWPEAKINRFRFKTEMHLRITDADAHAFRPVRPPAKPETFLQNRINLALNALHRQEIVFREPTRVTITDRPRLEAVLAQRMLWLP